MKEFFITISFFSLILILGSIKYRSKIKEIKLKNKRNNKNTLNNNFLL